MREARRKGTGVERPGMRGDGTLLTLPCLDFQLERERREQRETGKGGRGGKGGPPL